MTPQGASRTPPSRPPPRAITWKQRLLLSLFGVGLVLVGLAALEGILALSGLGDPHLYEDPFVGFSASRDLFSETRGADGGVVYATNPGKLSFFHAQEFPVEKGPDTYRIFALGGSTTAGRPYDWKVAFPRFMELYLEEMDPSRPYEVINAGAISYASYRIVVLMRELVRYDPDLFVIYTGHNEFLEERTYSDLIHENLAVKRLRIWLNRFRFFTLARQATSGWRDGEGTAKTTLGSEVEAKLDVWTGLDLYRRDDELRRSIVEHFEYNLLQMVRIARDHGVQVVFVEPASNLKDFSPFKSEAAASLSSRQREELLAAVEGSRQYLAGGATEEAAAAAQAALTLDSDYAEAHFRLGQALLAGEDPQRARESFVRARELDVAPLRAIEAIRERVVEISRAQGVPWVPLPTILEEECERRLGHRILGNEYFQDHVHPDLPVHSLIAERVIDRLLAEGEVRLRSGWTPAARPAIYDELLGSMDREYYAQRDHNLAKVLAWAGKTEEAEAPMLRAAEVLGHHPEVHLNLGILYEKSGRYEDAARELRQAVALDPESADAQFNLGTILGYLGETEGAILALETALRLRPAYPLAQFNLGVLHLRAGALDEALAALEAAQRLRPDAAEIPRNLGLVYRGQGRWEEALAALDQALALEPRDAEARTELGITYGRMGRLDEAAGELEAALEIAPRHAEAHYNLGVVLGQRGELEPAAGAYERCVELDPTHHRSLNNLGILYARTGRLSEARDRLSRAIEVNPGYAEAYLNLAVVLDQGGQLGPALETLRRGLEVAPDHRGLHAAIASLYEAVGDRERARRHRARVEESGGSAGG